MAEGAGDGSGGASGVKPGALTALLQEVAATPEKREEEPLSLPPGTVIGRFEIIRELGRGGFGVVYEAKDRDLGRQVAVKVVRPGRITEEEGKVSREAEAIACLAHPNLITLHEVGRSEHGPFLVFELLRGKTLDLRIEEGPLAVQEAVHVATEVARGLAHAHAEGVIHRDLKPANVFITKKGQVKILDFGMAHAFGRRRVSGGTPAYMAPEQWEDDPEDERTDVFALGVMLYRMLTGEYPFPEGEGRWAAEPAPVRRLDVPGAPELADVVERMLDRTPKGRPRDGAAVLAALAPIEEKLRARPADGKPPEHAKRRKATFGDLLAELKRRHVFRVMIGYGVVAFAVLQVIEPIMHGAHLPDWVLTAVLVALALGFPVAVVLAWVYDLTAQGVKRTPSASGPGVPSFGRSRLLLPLAVAAGVLVIAAAGAGGWRAWKRASEPGRNPATGGGSPSVAVLPFADLSPGHDQEYLADGVAEEVLNGLAQVDGLRVVGRSTAFSFKGKGTKVEEIGRDLGVGTVLEGSVRRSGDKVRITAQLVRTTDASTLWSRSFERSLSDVFAVQEEIARAVVEALSIRLVPGRTLARTGGSTDPEALQLYLRGRDQLRRGGQELNGAWEAFEKAVKVDPRFALAWVGIADAIVTIEATADDAPGDPGARRRRAHEAADVAVGLAPGLADAFRARADVRQWLEADWRGQREDVERARALSPGDSAVALSGGFSLLVQGRTDESVAEFERVTRIDPLLERGWVSGWLGLFSAAYSRRDHPKARQAAARMAELFPGYRVFALAGIAMDRVVAGEAREALSMADEFRAMGPPGSGWALFVEALACADLGRPADAARARDALARESAAFGPYQVAQTFARAGDADAAFGWLERARKLPDTAMFWLKTDPLLDALRGDPRWPALLERAGLPPDPARAVTEPPSIAVLPFADMSPKHDQEYLSDGVAEEILNALSRVEGLKVIGRTSSFFFKGKSVELAEIGRRLGVATILEGSVRTDGRRIRVGAQLVRVSDGARLWSEAYERDAGAAFAIQDDVARDVARSLRVKLLPAARESVPSTPEAHTAYLLALHLANASGSDEGQVAAQAAWARVAELDPGFAPAQAALAVLEVWTAPWPLPEANRSKAWVLASRAIALSPQSADGYSSRAWLRVNNDLDWAGGEADIAEAIRRNPSAGEPLVLQGVIHAAFRRRGLAIESLRRALEFNPLKAHWWRMLSDFLLAEGDMPGARRAALRSLEISPGGTAAGNLIVADLLEGKARPALEAAARQPKAEDRLLFAAMAEHTLGHPAESRKAIAELTAAFGESAPYRVAQAHAWTGHVDDAFDWLERTRAGGFIEGTDFGLVRGNPVLRGLQSDPRWKDFLRKFKVPVD